MKRASKFLEIPQGMIPVRGCLFDGMGGKESHRLQIEEQDWIRELVSR